MHYSMKKAEKAVQTARQTARDTTIAVKKTAKAVTHAIKALMEATKALLSGLTAGGWIAVVILIIVILFGGFLQLRKIPVDRGLRTVEPLCHLADDSLDLKKAAGIQLGHDLEPDLLGECRLHFRA